IVRIKAEHLVLTTYPQRGPSRSPSSCTTVEGHFFQPFRGSPSGREGGCDCPPQNICQCQEIFSGFPAERKEELLTSVRWGPPPPGLALSQLRLLMSNSSSAQTDLGKLRGSLLGFLASLINGFKNEL
ncbi:mCG145200, partial [Mus musculus]